MTVRPEFHYGKHTDTDDWMDEHPILTYSVAIVFTLGIIGLFMLVLMFVFHS